MASSEVIAYRYSVTITSATRKLYYRPAQGGCNCRSFYNGQDDLLFNLDNKHFFTYGLLFQYFHLIIEGKNPLDAFHRSAGQCHGVLGTTSDLEGPSLSQECSRELSIESCKLASCRHRLKVYIRKLQRSVRSDFHSISPLISICVLSVRACSCHFHCLGLAWHW